MVRDWKCNVQEKKHGKERQAQVAGETKLDETTDKLRRSTRARRQPKGVVPEASNDKAADADALPGGRKKKSQKKTGPAKGARTGNAKKTATKGGEKVCAIPLIPPHLHY